MDAERSIFEIVRLLAREEFDHVLKVNEPIIYRCRRQQVNLFAISYLEQAAVSRGPSFTGALNARISKMVCLINNDGSAACFT